MHQITSDEVVHLRMVQWHRTNIEETLQTLALAVAVKIEDKRGRTSAILPEV